MLGGMYSKEFKFDNGYGASVVSHSGSYGGDKGLFEVAVLNADGEIVYNTPITADVIGFLDFAGVVEILDAIKRLPKAGTKLLTLAWMEANGCKTSQMRGTGHLVHNGGWYNAAGEKIGWGDLDEADLNRLADNLPSDAVLFILGEQDSFWKFVTFNPGIVGDMCQTSADEKLPGMEYVLSKAFMVLVNGQWYYVDRLGFMSKPEHCLSDEEMRKLVTPLLYQYAPA